MTEDAFLTMMIVFFIIPSILLSARIYFDTARYLRSGYLASSVVSLLFAIGSYLFFAVACGMTLWRSRKRVELMDRIDTAHGAGKIPLMEALGRPLSEATILHSYIVPTGLWLCKASFVAMYFNLKRHLNLRTKRLLYFTVFYLVFSYLVVVFSHGWWCGGSFGKQWADSSTSYCTPFTAIVTISINVFMNITSDILVLSIPLMILHYITVLPRERYAIIFLLFLGLGTIVTTSTCCALHITYRHHLVVYYSYVQLAELLAFIELSVALTAVSLPSLKAVLYRKQENRRRKMQSSSGAGESKRTACSSTPGTDTQWEVEPDARSEDEGRLVILRRVSYDVESMELPPFPKGTEGSRNTSRDVSEERRTVNNVSVV
ncbi:hypothetical protein K440DRAFT_661623 [Wilcoxina mikolae CBS 423.85]|nr:hypothetical protein K440DRAFT_661623 [Wilcoxina mikolae CBS 423.85]